MTLSTRFRRACPAFVLVLVLNGIAPAQAQTLSPASVQAPRPASVTSVAPAVSEPSRPFGALFRDTVNDFQRLRSQELVTVLAIGAMAATAAHGMDRPATEALSGASFGGVFGAGEAIGSARVQLAGALVTYAAGRAFRDASVSAIGADLIRANIVAQAMTAGVKLSARRGRPDGTRFSFPSGHTSVTFATATVLQRHLGWKAGIPAYALASYVAASRIHDKRHFLSDVTFGAAVGLVAGRTVTIGRGGTAFTVAPMAAAGGGGIGVTWTGR